MINCDKNLNSLEKHFIKIEDSLKKCSYIPVASLASGAALGCFGIVQLALGLFLTLGTFVFGKLTGNKKAMLAAERFVQWIPNGTGNIVRGLGQMIPFSGNLACYIQDGLPGDVAKRYFRYKPVRGKEPEVIMELVALHNGQRLEARSIQIDENSPEYQKYLDSLEVS